MLNTSPNSKQFAVISDMSQATTPTSRPALKRRGNATKIVAYNKENLVEARGSSLEHAGPLLATSGLLSTSKVFQSDPRRSTLELAEHSANNNGLLATKEDAYVWKQPLSKVLPSTVLREGGFETNNEKKLPVKHKQSIASWSNSLRCTQKLTFKNIFVYFFGAIVLLFTITCLETTTWIWNQLSQQVHPPPTFNHLEGLQVSTNTTNKWIQTQLELLDLKLNMKAEAVKKDIESKLYVQTLKLETAFNVFKSRIEILTSAVARLTDQGRILSRREGVDLVMYAAHQRASDYKDKISSLDDLLSVAREIVLAELEKHAADGIGRVDYALASGGGKVTSHSEPYLIHSRATNLLGLGYRHGLLQLHPMADKVLEPSFGEPGHCLPLKGTKVYVEISLRTAIFPEAVTLEHVSKTVAYDIRSAPSSFRVFGWLEREIQREKDAKMLLGEYNYDVHKESIQTFPISKDFTSQLIDTVMVHVLSNHGNPSHTCLYRVRVHGSEPSQGTHSTRDDQTHPKPPIFS